MGIINAVTGMFKSGNNEAPKPEEKPTLVAPKATIEPLAEPKSYLELKEWLKSRTLHIKARKKKIIFCREELVNNTMRRISEGSEAPLTYSWIDDRHPDSHASIKRTMSHDYRIHHIAYSMLRGKTMEQIEPKTENPLGERDLKRIDELKAACARPPRAEKQG